MKFKFKVDKQDYPNFDTIIEAPSKSKALLKVKSLLEPLIGPLSLMDEFEF